uniref:Uncharacterized protein n=1 Tax=Anguilla anguilla TaxID=7936 RepID=A0A0E9XFN3_ANGAN
MGRAFCSIPELNHTTQQRWSDSKTITISGIGVAVLS